MLVADQPSTEKGHTWTAQGSWGELRPEGFAEGSKGEGAVPRAQVGQLLRTVGRGARFGHPIQDWEGRWVWGTQEGGLWGIPQEDLQEEQIDI